jgi:hypothetical protein
MERLIGQIRSWIDSVLPAKSGGERAAPDASRSWARSAVAIAFGAVALAPLSAGGRSGFVRGCTVRLKATVNAPLQARVWATTGRHASILRWLYPPLFQQRAQSFSPSKNPLGNSSGIALVSRASADEKQLTSKTEKRKDGL